jgi:hypothetical protein
VALEPEGSRGGPCAGFESGQVTAVGLSVMLGSAVFGYGLIGSYVTVSDLAAEDTSPWGPDEGLGLRRVSVGVGIRAARTDQTGVVGGHGGLQPVPHAEFGEDALYVGLDRGLGQVQRGADLGIGQPPGHQ